MKRLSRFLAALLICGGAAVMGKGVLVNSEEKESSAYLDESLRRGVDFLYGMNGRAIDVYEAMSRFVDAAKIGDPMGVYYQAVMIGDGWGVNPPDPGRARRLLDRAYLQLRADAADGHIEALYAVAEITASGRMADPDPEDARRALEVCIRENYPGGLRELGRIELNAGRHVNAAGLLRRAAEKGDATASWLLSRALLEQGDVPGAREALLAAARLNQPSALGEVARRSPDAGERRRYLGLAAEAGDARSQYELALALRVEGNHDGYLSWLETAVSYGYAPAYMELAGVPLRRHAEVEKMLLAQWAAEAGIEEGRQAVFDLDYQDGLALAVRYSTRHTIAGPAGYPLLTRDINVVGDRYLGGREGEAMQLLDETVRFKAAALPASLPWFSFYRRGVPLAWLSARPETLDTLGWAVASGLAGQAAPQHRYAAALAEEAALRPEPSGRIGRLLAAVLDAHAYALEGDAERQWQRLGELDLSDADQRVAVVNFINHFAPALRRDRDRLAGALHCDGGEIAPAIPVVKQEF